MNSPSPWDGGSARGDLYTFNCSREDLLVLTQVLQQAHERKTLVPRNNAVQTALPISNHTPIKFRPGENVTNGEVEVLIDQTFKQMPFHSTHKNTALGIRTSREKLQIRENRTTQRYLPYTVPSEVARTTTRVIKVPPWLWSTQRTIRHLQMKGWEAWIFFSLLWFECSPHSQWREWVIF